jgi:hypothetical protein
VPTYLSIVKDVIGCVIDVLDRDERRLQSAILDGTQPVPNVSAASTTVSTVFLASTSLVVRLSNVTNRTVTRVN